MPPSDRTRSLHARVLALSTAQIGPPHVDPRIAALTALGLVDFAKSDDGKARFAELAALGAFDPGKLDDLQMLAEALLGVVDRFDAAPRAPKPIVVPQQLETECRARRGKLATLLGGHAQHIPEVARALRQMKLSYGPIDLAADLRTLAAHVQAHAALLDQSPVYQPDLVESSRALARSLEGVLYASDTPELVQARSALHRLWSLFEIAYREVAELGREIFTDGADGIFPSLEAIAEVARTARHHSSSKLPAAALVEQSMPSSRRAAMSRHVPSRRMSERPPPPAIDAPLLSLDVTLNANSESNLYLGFSQDVAEGGVFVATYDAHPLGARVALSIHFDEHSAPLQLDGHVHWLRPHSAGPDAPVGLGVRLADVSVEVAQQLQAFAVRRTPIFYDD